MTGQAAAARHWIERWERQQERYAIHRERRFTAMIDVIEHAAAGIARPLVVDLGCGPASLAQRIHDRIPRAEIVAVDADPFLLVLAGAGRPRVARYVQATLGDETWLGTVALERAPDVFATSTTLHYLSPPQLATLYGQLASALRPGGLVVNGDHLPPDDGPIAALAAAVGSSPRAAPRDHADDWSSWWTGVAEDRTLGPLLATTGRLGPAVDGDHVTSEPRHVELLLAAGFRAAGTVWRSADSAVLVAVS